MAQNESAKKPVPPYISKRTLTNLLESWRVHLPGRIDRSVLGNQSGGAQSAILSALRYLQLIDSDGEPQQALEQLVKTEGPQHQQQLRSLLENSYPFMFEAGFDIEKATPAQIQERFQQTGASGDTLSKCLTFFAAVAKDAGIKLTPHLKTRQRRSNGTKRSNGKAKPRRGQRENEDPPPANTPPPPQTQVPAGMERLPIPGIPGAFIQYPSNLTSANCDLFEAMVGVLRTYAKTQQEGGS